VINSFDEARNRIMSYLPGNMNKTTDSFHVLALPSDLGWVQLQESALFSLTGVIAGVIFLLLLVRETPDLSTSLDSMLTIKVPHNTHHLCPILSSTCKISRPSIMEAHAVSLHAGDATGYTQP